MPLAVKLTAFVPAFNAPVIVNTPAAFVSVKLTALLVAALSVMPEIAKVVALDFQVDVTGRTIRTIKA